MATHITPAAFARLIGVSPPAVNKAIKEGRISVLRDERGRPLIDPEAAAREWSANSRFRIESSGARNLQKTVDAIPKRSLSDVRIARETYEAKLAELKYKTAIGELMRTDEALARWGSLLTMARTKLLAVPSKAKIRMPDLSATQVGIIEDLIREALEDLSEADETGEKAIAD